MKIKRLAIRKFKNIQAFTPVLVVGVLVVGGAVIYNFNTHAATAGFTFDSSSTNYKIGDTINVGVYEDSGSDCANVVEADFTYPSNVLRYDSFSASGSKFETPAPSSSDSSKVSIIQFTTRKECGSGGSMTSGVSGKQLIGTATFTAIAAGTSPLNFLTSSTAISAANNKSNVAPGSDGLSFTITAPADPTPIPTPPAPSPQPAPAPQPLPVTSITPTDTDTSIPLEDNDVVELTTPVDVQPLPVQPDGINRIEYYLNSKLVATVKTAPYTYHLDTSKYLNGTYTMTTKKFYANGQSNSVSQTVVIKNPFGLSQFKLWIQKYIWLVILLLIIIAAIIVALILHKRRGGPTNYYGDGSLDNAGDYAVSTGSFVKPSSGPTSDATAELPTASEPQVYKPAGSTASTDDTITKS